MGWTAASKYVLDYFFFLPTFSPAASKSDKSSSFFCVGIQSGESRRRRAGVESKTPESYLLDLLLRRGLGHGDARRLGRVGIKTLEVREALLRLFDQFIVLRDDVVVQKLVLRRDHEGLQADEALLGVAVLLGFRFGRFSFFLALALLLGVARARARATPRSRARARKNEKRPKRKPRRTATPRSASSACRPS